MSRRIWAAGGLAVLMTVSTAWAQPGRGRGGFGGGSATTVGLLRAEEVRKELGTTDDQNAKLDDLQRQIRDAAGGGSRESFQGLSDEERTKRFAEMREKADAANKEAEAKLASILDAKQMERLNQLLVRREGVAALARPEVAAKLGLSDDQKAQVKTALESGRQSAGGTNFRDMSDEERQAAFAAMRERREKAEADALAVLTADQKAKFEEMKGKEFEFPRPNFGGRGNGGNGGNGGGRPRVD